MHSPYSYLEMSEEDQKSKDKITERLLSAFTDSSFVAFGKLVIKRCLRWLGEPVDVFANDMRKLARLAGFEGESLERLVRLNFVNGFPEHISVELQQMPGVEKLEMT